MLLQNWCGYRLQSLEQVLLPHVAAVVERAFQEHVDGDTRHSLRQQPGVDLTGAAASND